MDISGSLIKKIRHHVWLILTICVITALTGCGNTAGSEQGTGNNVTQTTDETWTGEPTLSSSAQKEVQFTLPAVGDTVAEIIVQDYGSLLIALFPDQAPLAVENFLTHAEEGYYDGMLFHRVISDFMIQSGDPLGTGYGGESIFDGPFADEISAQLHPFRGALCMANTGKDSNTSQFFIVQKSAASLSDLKALVDYKGYSFSDYLKSGYDTELTQDMLSMYDIYGGAPWLDGHHTVFGQIFEGFDVLDAIAGAAVDATYRPQEDIIIQSVNVFTY